MNDNSKMKFHPINKVKADFSKTHKEIIEEFLTYGQLQAINLNIPTNVIYQVSFKDFFRQIQNYILNNYGQPVNELTIGDISNLWLLYQHKNYMNKSNNN